MSEIHFNTSNTGLSVQQTNNYHIDKFNGVDYTTAPSQVDPTRAIDMSNYLPKSNSLVKRNGFRQSIKFADDEELLNVWNFGNKFRIYAYVKKGNNVYLRYYMGYDGKYDEYLTILQDRIVNTNGSKGYMVEYDNKIFFFSGGDYYIIAEEDRIPTAHSLTTDGVDMVYIPLTFVGIRFTEEKNVTTQAVMIEDFNLLSGKFKIQLIAPNEAEMTTEFTARYDLNFIGKKIGYAVYDDEDKSEDISVTNNVIELKFVSNGTNLNVSHNNKSLGVCELGGAIELTCGEFAPSSHATVAKMQFGALFGTGNTSDRLFLSGNPDYPNLDIHSGYASFADERYKDLTYFRSNDYQFFGSSSSAITGYGILNNGYMVIIKENNGAENNLYFRYGTIEKKNLTNAQSNLAELIGADIYDEKYPVINSGVDIQNKKENQLIKYNNDLLIINSDGVFNIEIGTSSATQVYNAVEVSHNIREDLAKDMTGSSAIVFDNKLFVSRLSKSGKKRIYVADYTRYTFINSKQQYEWWVLDDLDVENMFVINEELYIYNKEYGLCVMTDGYVDEYSDNIEDVVIYNQTFSNDVSIFGKYFILPNDHRILNNIMSYDDPREKYEEFKNTTYVSFVQAIRYEIDITQIDYESGKIYFSGMGNDEIIEKIIFENPNKYEIYFDTMQESDDACDIISMGLSDNEDIDIYMLTTDHTINFWDYPNRAYIVLKENKLKIKELYASVNGEYIPFDIYNEQGLIYNIFTLEYLGEEFTNEQVLNYISGITFHYEKPVKAYWYGKHESFDRLDYLKSVVGINFTTSPNEDNVTKVGYRTSRKEKTYEAVARNSMLDFELVDFNNIGFGTNRFSQTYSSKKKIKNFSFIQLMFASEKPLNSTIGEVNVRYKYTKTNKGVK